MSISSPLFSLCLCRAPTPPEAPPLLCVAVVEALPVFPASWATRQPSTTSGRTRKRCRQWESVVAPSPMPRPSVARVIATRRPSGTVHPLFPANSDVQDVLVHLRSSSSGSLTSYSSSSSSRRHEQSLSGLRSPARFASSSPWIPNPLCPKLLHPPSVLPNPFNRSPTPHLAGNRRSPVRRRAGTLELHLHVDDLPSAPLCSN